jgi:hypothetical protein
MNDDARPARSRPTPAARRWAIALVACTLLVGVVLAGWAVHEHRDPTPTVPATDQCSLPLSERTGGWVCLG